MITIGKPVAVRSNPSKSAVLSAVLHLGLFSIILIHPIRVHPRAEIVRLPGTDKGSFTLFTYSPGKVAHYAIAQRDPQMRAAATIPSPVAVVQPPRKAAPTTTTHPSDTPDALTGDDARGSGKINIASTIFSPSPRPDLSVLPRGSRGDVILDVTIDSTGKIADIRMTSGLGYGVDETVIAIVQQWTFRPATRDGQPIASEQELHFHYETRG